MNGTDVLTTERSFTVGNDVTFTSQDDVHRSSPSNETSSEHIQYGAAVLGQRATQNHPDEWMNECEA